MNRHDTAYNLLKELYTQDFYFLGQGKTSVVFHDGEYVYKVFILDDLHGLSYKRHIINTIEHHRNKFNHSKYFYSIHDIIPLDDHRFIIKYPYEISNACTSFEFDEIINFLVECWQKRLIFQDIKPENFIRIIDGTLKWIDYEPDKFTDNLYLNMAVRAFIYFKYPYEKESFLAKLCRSAINQFHLKELDGVQDFLNHLYCRIIFNESNKDIAFLESKKKEVISQIGEIENEGIFQMYYSDSFNPHSAFWDVLKRGIYLEKFEFDEFHLDQKNYFAPKHTIIHARRLIQPDQPVSLVIKACTQDAEIIYASVSHIIKQLSFPNSFDEKILSLDIRKDNFLREYNSENTWQQLLYQTEKLVNDGIVDKVIYPKTQDILFINQKWFGIQTETTHTYNKIPVTAQLYAFENVKNNYILQVDCDAMIGRLDRNHSFLNDMINELEKNEHVISVGFNIYKGDDVTFTPYFGFDNGGFVPEVRFCMIHKKRIQNLLPLPNEIFRDGFKLSWYRSLETKQKETGFCSIRGGDSRTFFIHPLNFKKTDKDVWFTMVNRVEQAHIPKYQTNEFDLMGSYYDWTKPKRNEEVVVVSCFRNISFSRFLRFWYSLISQTNQNWGLILIDDASDNGIHLFIESLIEPYKSKITFIKNCFRVGVAQNTYKAIHYFMENQESIVCILDADDAFIGKNALKNIYEKYTYFEADVVVGKMYRTDKLYAHYPYTPNFTRPRDYGGNVWQHLRSFKKYLFDSLDFNDLKIKNSDLDKTSQDILLSRKFNKTMVFPEYCWDYAYMVPIIEMSLNPMWINHYNILHDRTTINTSEIKEIKENEIAEILSKPPKNPENVFKGRKSFLPNLHKIEIDITYECNLKCINCNRSSTQAPITEGMEIGEIQKFIEESIELGKKWELINLLGGEPTIHKNFIEIVNIILYDYIVPHSPDTILQITSNGFGDDVQKNLSELPQHPKIVIDKSSFKEEKVISYFSPFNNAPIDMLDYHHSEYHKGCWVTSYCGIGLNQLGYYPCGVAGGIDRVMQLDMGIKSLKQVDENIKHLLNSFCCFCGNFKDYEHNQGNFIPRNEKSTLNKPIISQTWKTAYKKYNGK